MTESPPLTPSPPPPPLNEALLFLPPSISPCVYFVCLFFAFCNFSHVSSSISSFISLSVSLSVAICSFVSPRLCCRRALARRLTSHFTREKSYKRSEHRESLEMNGCRRRASGPDKVGSQGKRRTFMKVSNRKDPPPPPCFPNPHPPLIPSQPKSMLQNPPKPDPLTSHQLFNPPLLYNHPCLQGLPGQL